MTDLSPEKRGLKTALRILVDSVGGTDAAAMILGHKQSSSVSHALSFDVERFLSWEQVLRLEAAAPEPVVSDWMKRRHETERAPSRHKLCLNDLARCYKEGGDAKSVLAEALADGVIDDFDKKRLVKEFTDVIDLYIELRRAVSE